MSKRATFWISVCVVLFFVLPVLFLLGLQNLRRAIVDELTESAEAINNLNQGFNIAKGDKVDPAADKKDAWAPLVAAHEPLEALGLPRMVVDSLKAAGLKTVGDLTVKQRADVAALKGIDPEDVTAIEAAFLKNKLTWESAPPAKRP